MKNNKQTTTTLLLILGATILLSGLVSAGAIQDVRNYWVEKGLNNQSAYRISRGIQTPQDTALAQAIESQAPIEKEVNQTTQQIEDIDLGALFLILLFGVIPLVAIVVVVVLFVRNQ